MTIRLGTAELLKTRDLLKTHLLCNSDVNRRLFESAFQASQGTPVRLAACTVSLVWDGFQSPAQQMHTADLLPHRRHFSDQIVDAGVK